MGRLENDLQKASRERASAMMLQPDDLSSQSTTADITARYDGDAERFNGL